MGSVARLTTAFWISTLFALAAPASIRAAQGDEALDHFHRAIDGYMALRRAAELRVTPLEVTPMPDEIQQAMNQLATALREARAGTPPGDIFTTDVRLSLRARLRHALAAHECAKAMKDGMDEPVGFAQPPVAGRLFSWTTAIPTPPCVLAVLPPLPDVLEYRFVGSALALVDVDTSLVVDVLPNAR